MSLVNHLWSDLRRSTAADKNGILSNRGRPARLAASATRELRQIAVPLVIFLAIMIAFGALDIWIWIPRLNH
jgi:hypothetical protein